MKKFVIELVEHSFIIQRWDEIEALIVNAFNESSFNDGYTVESLLREILDADTKQFIEGLKHVIALSEENKILGSCFCVPTSKMDNETGADVGWFFTSSELSQLKKLKVADAIMTKVHEEMRKAGFQQVITDMGTQAGAKFFSKRFGYIHSPIAEQSNRWIKEL
ncbi:hypothetical protein PI95_001395 [Hassallia byssoidea VB512170]|uniref:N-acetyltransferase domain-containing protein n=1 Tax=Hassallia byssoidea VB512170 TaxID=1304833 RepID=A0A846H3W5_9CYAN|nr:hypothetical protein [Hassalia byssoidea]NEU71269.1 hypothetical protein [Hassalia byssoidea VB512170]